MTAIRDFPSAMEKAHTRSGRSTAALREALSRAEWTLTQEPKAHPAILWAAAPQSLFEQLVEIGVPDDYRRFFQRWRASLEDQQPCAQTAEVTVAGRMVVGLGAESVLEVSIGLHRTYGVPYIPGSALKGLAAAAAHKKLEDPNWRKVGEDGKIGASHKILFGDQESSGYVTFHDALWVPTGDKLPLDLDVMTVHHPDYYQGKECPPADWDNPNPVAFLSAHGTYLPERIPSPQAFPDLTNSTSFL
jgi:CRISPR-associated protein Cmr6